MGNNGKNMLIAAAVLAFCIVLSSSSTLIQGTEKTYEIRPEITLPEQKTDTTRFIESYERLLDRLITTTEKSQFSLTDDISSVGEKLELMDKKLDEILVRIQKIEKSLNIDEKTTVSGENNTSNNNVTENN
ncbi:MAG TPA: hypothetical protein PLP05_02880 [Sedimentisphaerales bacterium]|nr:hypothetical protein [Sedimentisphaerales bacterium]